jgi:hypothetical protein
MIAIPPEVVPLFYVGTRHGCPAGTHSVIVVHVGELNLPTGRMIVQDPRWGIDREVPLAAGAAPGVCGRWSPRACSPRISA